MGSKTRLSSYCTKRANNGVNLVMSRNINTRLARPIALNECGLSTGMQQRLLSFLRRKVWGIDCVVTRDMKVGLANEDEARNDYLQRKQQHNLHFSVEKSGLWVNLTAPQLACSPDGIVHDPSSGNNSGLLEIKILKIFQSYSPDALIERYQNGELIEKISSTCFKIDNGIISLRTSHQYYYQIQFQLGVTGFSWCDFVLWSPKGNPVIQRISRDEQLITDIKTANKNLWHKVVEC